MIITRLKIVLAGLLLIVVCLIVLLDADLSQPNYEFLPNMKRSGASNAFSANNVFPDGRTMQAPVAGTIARGDLPLYYAPTKEDAIRAGEELAIPTRRAERRQPSGTTTAQPVYRRPRLLRAMLPRQFPITPPDPTPQLCCKSPFSAARRSTTSTAFPVTERPAPVTVLWQNEAFHLRHRCPPASPCK